MFSEIAEEMAMQEAQQEGWLYDGTMLRHPDRMIIFHIPSLGVLKASRAAIVHLALSRDQACLLRLRPKQAASKTTPKRSRVAPNPVTQPAQLRLFEEAA